jgi:hypothetical protein
MKKKNEGAELVTESNGNPYEADLSRASPEFSLEKLLETFQTKKNESAARKISLNERMETARRNISRLQSYITQLQTKAQSEVGQVFLTLICKPIAEEIRSIFPNAGVDLFGPHGLSGQVIIGISRKGANQSVKIQGADCHMVTLVPTEDGVGIRDYSKSSNEHLPGSLGFISGLNHPVVSVPKEKTLEFIIEWLLK